MKISRLFPFAAALLCLTGAFTAYTNICAADAADNSQAMMRTRAFDFELIIYPQYDERIQRCYDYSVTVYQGDKNEKLTVYNRNTSGEQMTLRCFKPDFNRRFCEFAFTGEVRVDIEVCSDFSSYSILPSAKDYRNEYHDGIISVWLNENDTDFILRLDDDDDSIA